MIIKNYGILASISWNSKKWADNPTIDDLEKSNYDYVKNNRRMHESLNFGHDIFPSEPDGYYIGYTPMFNTPPALDKSKNVCIVFFSSTDYKNSNRKNIVGFYGFPVFGGLYERTSEHDFFDDYNNGNIKAFPENIIYFENPIVIDNDNVQENKLLPVGKKISHQGFNYLNSDNVYNLIKVALSLNETNKKIKSFVDRFPLMVELRKEKIDLSDFIIAIDNTNADSVEGIQRLEKKMKKQSPEIKQRISTFIERGSMSNKVKKLTKYKCLICEAKGENPYSFEKPNGKYYVETHHVEPVSTLEKGVLSISNLITVCANHHRQLHYGNSKVIEDTNEKFKFEIDKEIIEIKKITIANNSYTQ